MTYPSVYGPIPTPDLENWNVDRSVDPPVMVRGIMYRTSAGEWYYGDDLRRDTRTDTLQTITYEHHEIHAGSHFYATDVNDLSINNVFDVQFTTANSTKWTHFTFGLISESETQWYIYEGATINTPGTAMTPLNNDRNSSTLSVNAVSSILNASVADANADTQTSAATEIAHGIIGAGKDGGVNQRDREIILKQNTIYCMRAVATAAGYINFNMEWYEHTNR